MMLFFTNSFLISMSCYSFCKQGIWVYRCRFQGWAQGKKKKPEVKILGDYC